MAEQTPPSPLNPLADGFDTGFGFRLPWGITLAEALRRLAGRTCRESVRSSSRSFPIARALGLPALALDLSAPALDRPILWIRYELWRGADCPNDDVLIERVSGVLGPPTHREAYDISAYRDPSPSVRLYVRWEWPEHSAGLSIYGAPRFNEEGYSDACLGLRCSTPVATHGHDLRNIEVAQARLDDYVRHLEILGTETLGFPQYHHWRDEDEAGSPARTAETWLHRRHLRRTPKALAGTLADNQAALWKSTIDGVWGLSTRWDTVCFPLDERPRIAHVEMLPARGSGFTLLTASDLELMSLNQCPAIGRFVKAIEDHGLAEIDHRTGSDC